MPAVRPGQRPPDVGVQGRVHTLRSPLFCGTCRTVHIEPVGIQLSASNRLGSPGLYLYLQKPNPETGEVGGPRGREPTRFGTALWTLRCDKKHTRGQYYMTSQMLRCAVLGTVLWHAVHG